MGWDDDLPPPPKTAAAPPGKPPGSGPVPPVARLTPRRRTRFGLQHLMVVIAGCAVIFLLGRKFADSGMATDALVLAIGVGFFVSLAGIWLIWRIEGAALWGWVLAIVGYMVMSAALFNGAAVISWPVLIVSLIVVLRRKRATEQDALVGVIAIAAGREMPLAPGIEAFADQTGWNSGRRARSLATLLDQGWALADAVEALPRTVSRPARVLIRAGSNLGALAPALHEVATSRARHQPALRAVVGRLAYLFWMGLIGQAIVAFVAYFIVPKFEAIFKDFGIELPAITQFVSGSFRSLGSLGTGIGLSELAIFLLLRFGIWFAELALVVLLILELTGRGLGPFTPFSWLTRRRDAALILRALALAVDAGRPIDPTVETLAETFPSRSIRRRLRRATRDLANGEPWVDSLRLAGLLTRSEAGVLDAASRAGNLAWALREVASLGERRWADRLQVGSQLAFFAAMLMAGALVFLIAVAYFLPLIELISKLGPA